MNFFTGVAVVLFWIAPTIWCWVIAFEEISNGYILSGVITLIVAEMPIINLGMIFGHYFL